MRLIAIPEDGLKIVLDNFRISMNISRHIAVTEVFDSAPLLEAQRELGIRK